MDTRYIDASKVQPLQAPLPDLLQKGLVKAYQGEPIETLYYPLPDFDPKDISPVAGLGVCLVRFEEKSTWALAKNRHHVNPWEFTAAFVRLGYFPPLQLIEQLDKSPTLTPVEANEVIEIVLEVISPRIQQLIDIRTNMMKIKQALHW